LVCAHYDSISELSSLEQPGAPAPGADDNATGTAAVLEFARASRGHAYHRNVIYICYSGEEEGLLGSSHFASKMATAGEPLLGVLNMDMLGFKSKSPEDADFVTNRNSVWLAEYARAAVATYVADLYVDVVVDEKMWRSDHAPYWALGYAANLVIEDWPLIYKYANTSKDTIEKVNFGAATTMTRGVVAAAASLASPTSQPATSSLDAVSVYPNPYKAGVHQGRVYFADLPPYSQIDFYNIAGELVWEGGNGAEPLWALELELKAEPIKSSGVYLYVIEAPSGERKIGKLAVIR
jgi:Zn-dependent M28 family amino/carboxypeptidase